MFGIKEVSGEQQRRILEELEEAAKLHGPFFVLVAASSVIVTFGLLLDSPVVVIGAMLVAPLMTCSARLPVYALLIGAFVPATSVGFLGCRGWHCWACTCWGPYPR
ncbi:MAG: hypothetical protein IH793_09670 [Acidobacteria bacterium]|nr:hypothetical protein [Acidobacteriota bacterium]